MAKLIMKGGQMVVEASTKAEEEELSKLAYASTTVTVEKQASKRTSKKADDE